MDRSLPPDITAEALNASTEAIVLVNTDGLIVFANRAAEHLFGYDAGELVDREIEVLIPEAQRQGHVAQRRAYATAPHARSLVSGLSLKGRRKDGESFEADVALTPIRSEAGTMVASAIRERVGAFATDRYFQNLLEAAPDAMIIIDADGQVVVVNAQAERMFGYARNDLLGKRIEQLLPERFRVAHVDHRVGYLDAPHVRPMGAGMQLAGLRSDGSEFPVEISLSPARGGDSRHVVSVIRDVTERKRLEQDLINARQEAERANKANTAFLAAASHDLRQPVQALALLNGALRRTVSEPLALEMLENQQLSLDAMTNLLNSLLDISRLDAGAITPEIEEFPIQRLIDRLAAEFGRQASQQHLEFHAEPSSAIVRSDPNLLGEVLQNLVSNAIRYTDKGRIELRCSGGDEYLIVDVIDSGIGIEPEQIDKIFQEFHQCKTPGASTEGFGLGLAIVRRLADLLELSVAVESTVGRGSRFSVSVPLVGRDADGLASSAPAGRGVSKAQGAGTILLVEDDAAVASAWTLLLEAEGYDVASASSARQAVAAARHLDHQPKLILSDFHLLEGSTGVDAVVAIRELYSSEIPAFIVSGDTSKVVESARSLPNCALISKPVDTDLLLDRVAESMKEGRVVED